VRDIIESCFYRADLAVGFGSPILLLVLRLRGRVRSLDWRLFWVGALIGMVWEVPIFVLTRHTSIPITAAIREFPFHYVVFMISHTLWDGAIFLAGVWLLRLFCAPPLLARFRWPELVVLLAWGQVSALLVELSAVLSRSWTFVGDYWWNPTLIEVGGYQITLMMQLLWLVAYLIFYPIAIRMNTAGRELAAT